MDETERKVLRRRRVHLADAIREVKKELVLELRRNGVLTDEELHVLEWEKNKYTKMNKLVDYVLDCRDHDAFHKFCAALEKYDKWLARNLKGDLKIEKGLVHVDEHISAETAMLVHRHFGTCTRFAEADKREIEQLMSEKLQVANEDWGVDLERLHNDLREEHERHNWKDDETLLITKELRDFVREHESKLTTHAQDSTTTSDALRLSEEDCGKEPLTKLREDLEKVLTRFSKVLFHKERIQSERKHCLHALGCAVTDTETLEHALRRYMDAQKAAKSKNEPKSKKPDKDDQQMTAYYESTRPSTPFADGEGTEERTVKRLNKKISDLEEEISIRDEKIKELKKQLRG